MDSSYMYSNFFIDLAAGIVILYCTWFFHVFASKWLRTQIAIQHYVGLYELKKVEEQLNERDLDFDSLDKFGERFYHEEKSKPYDLKSVDEKYSKQKENEKDSEKKK